MRRVEHEAELRARHGAAGRDDHEGEVGGLDGALQSLFATRSLDHTAPGDSIVPWRFGAVRLLKPLARPVSAACRLKRIGPKAHCADFALRDEAGEIVLEMLDCWFVRIRPALAKPAERMFRQAVIACAHQPAGRPTPKLPVIGPPRENEDAEAGELLGHAYATAVAFEVVRSLAAEGDVRPETLIATGRVAPESLDRLHTLLGWLEQDGLATRSRGAWRLAESSGLPAADQIWQSLFFDKPAASTEASLAAMNAAALPAVLRGTGAFPDNGLAERIFEAAPTARWACLALEEALRDLLAEWPAERPLRLAIVGRMPSGFLRQALALTADRVCRLTVFGAERLSQALADELRQRPGCMLERGGLTAACTERFDVLAGVFGLGAGWLTTAGLASASAPGAVALLAEAAPSRFWSLANDLQAPVAPEALADQLRMAEFQAVTWTRVGGGVWPAVILAGRATANAAAKPPFMPFRLAVDGPSSLAEALQAGCATGAIAIGDLVHASLESGECIVAVAPDGGESRRLASFCGDLAKATPALVAASAQLVLMAPTAADDPAAAALAGLCRVMINEGLEARLVHVGRGAAPAQILQ